MTLEDFGYNEGFENFRKGKRLDSFEVGRVISEHKERYVVKTGEKEYDAEIIGNLRFSAEKRSDFPAVGDWVAFSEYDENKALIHAVFPRKTIIERQEVGKQGEKQIIATNIDYAFIVQAVDRDFNINRIERYLTICNSSNVKPVIVLNKIDLIDEGDLANLIAKVQQRVKQVQVFALSNETEEGIESLSNQIEKGLTYCAVLAAVENGEIDGASYENYLKMEREKEHFESSVAEKRKKDKEFGKMIKHFKKGRKLNKY
jgi:ribosome biogenesis GTPase